MLVLMGPYLLCAQQKVEREYRIKRQKVPKEARNWLDDAYEDHGKVKWYQEQTETATYYEAKLEWEDHTHSVKFNSGGLIEDIEIEMAWEELPDQLQARLRDYFESGYQKYEVRKIQRQYTGSPDDLEDAIDEHETDDVTTRYELEFYGKTDSQDELWEGLFSDDGELIQKRVIKLRPVDNLIY